MALAVYCSLSMAAERPNVVLILVDDLGYGDLKSFGADDLRTPHIDELMTRGMRFDSSTPTVRSVLQHVRH